MVTILLLAKDELARLVLDLEDYDIPLTSDREDYPSLAIGIGDSSDIYTQSPTLPGTEVGLKLVLLLLPCAKLLLSDVLGSFLHR